MLFRPKGSNKKKGEKNGGQQQRRDRVRSKGRDGSTSSESRREDITWPIHAIYFIPEYCMCKGSFYIRGLYTAHVLGTNEPYAL